MALTSGSTYNRDDGQSLRRLPTGETGVRARAWSKAHDPDIAVGADPIAQAERLALLLPRFASAMWQASCRQLREVGGIDYTLIDYQGVAESARRFMLAWWLNPIRAFASQTDLV